MVKLLNTPFGNYGYVINPNAIQPEFNEINLVTSENTRFKPTKASTYDAKYLRTSELAKSHVFKARDPDSYSKRGLLHLGQLPKPKGLETATREVSTHVTPEVRTETQPGPSFQKDANAVIKLPDIAPKQRGVWSNSRFHGCPSMRGTYGFAKSYANARSGLGAWAKLIGSGCDLGDDFMTSGGSHDPKNEAMSSSQLLRIEPSSMKMSKLGRMKSERMLDVYSRMSRRHREQREKLIMDRVTSAENIKKEIHNNETQRLQDALTSSIDAQKKQLREVRSRHNKRYECRLASLYLPKTPAVQTKDSKSDEKLPNPPNVQVLPREMYGLPENENDLRPNTVRTWRKQRKMSNKISLDAFKAAKSNLSVNFNNVWNMTRPSTTANLTA